MNTQSPDVLSTAPLDPGLEKFTSIMDDQFEFLGFRFGINFFIDLVPGIGDIASTIIASYIFLKALEYRLPWFTLLRMLLNIGIFFLASLVPVIGDLFAAWWKPNRRNLKILRKSLNMPS